MALQSGKGRRVRAKQVRPGNLVLVDARISLVERIE
jgi:hypothetical protein